MIKYISNLISLAKSEDFKNIIAKNKQVIVDFYADWCPPCKAMMPVLESFASKNLDIIILKVNIDEFPDIAREFNILSIPTFLKYKKGKLLETIRGRLTEDQLSSNPS